MSSLNTQMAQMRLSPQRGETSSPAHYSPSTIHVEKPPKPIEDIFRSFNPCGPNIRVFGKVSTLDFATLESIVEKPWSLQQPRPKLSYHRASGLLFVEVPTPAYMFAITDFYTTVQLALSSLPINRRRLRIALEPNLTLESPLTDFSVTPGLALVSMSTGRWTSTNVFAVMECAYSQDRASLMAKIRDEVEGWPEITLVIAVIVTENCDYKSPLEGSPTWNYFAQHQSILSDQDFQSLPPSINGSVASSLVEHNPILMTPPLTQILMPLVLNPITIAGHTWYDLHDVQYHVWVKEDGVLDLDGDSTDGFLYPTIEMEAAEQAINNGLSAAKDGIFEVAAKCTKSKSALCNLQKAQFRVKFDWATIQATLRMTTKWTAISRYQTWFLENFRGIKRPLSDDESYHTSEVERE